MEVFNNAGMISHIGGALHTIVLGERFNAATTTTWRPCLISPQLGGFNLAASFPPSLAKVEAHLTLIMAI